MKYEDEVKGKGKQVKGAVKEKLGKLTGDRNLEDSGAADRTEGRVQQGLGKTKRKVGDAVADLGERIAR
ncbi:MAG TPA: CsbD family protein [Pyrinomonadaceae bacterium]|nr:CsbD family protein [Pyrinomonadaceae bacterium]